MQKKLLYFTIAFILFFIINIIHTSVISSTLESELKKLHASGLYIKMLDDKKHFLYTSKTFLIRLKKSELIAELLLGLPPKDPFTIALSRFEGTSLKMKLKHYNYTFSNTISMDISIDALPEHFTEGSTFLEDIVNTSSKQPDLLTLKYNLITHFFTLKLRELDKTFQADFNTTYQTQIDELILQGYINAYDEFEATLQTDKMSIKLLHVDKPYVNFFTHDFTILFERLPNYFSTTISSDEMSVELENSIQSKLTIHDLSSFQEHTLDQFVDISSQLNIDTLALISPDYNRSIQGFSYDIKLSHLDLEVLNRMKELIDSSNTNSYLFIFEDLSKELQKLLKLQAQIDINELKFNELRWDNKNYKNSKITLHAKPSSLTEPLDFQSSIILSPEIYELFLEHIPNGLLTQEYKQTTVNGEIAFNSKFTSEGLMINDMPIVKKVIKEVTPDGNQTMH